MLKPDYDLPEASRRSSDNPSAPINDASQCRHNVIGRYLFMHLKAFLSKTLANLKTMSLNQPALFADHVHIVAVRHGQA